MSTAVGQFVHTVLYGPTSNVQKTHVCYTFALHYIHHFPVGKKPFFGQETIVCLFR